MLPLVELHATLIRLLRQVHVHLPAAQRAPRPSNRAARSWAVDQTPQATVRLGTAEREHPRSVRAFAVNGSVSQNIFVRQLPLEMTRQFEAVEDQVAGLEEIGADAPIAFEDRTQRASSLVGERRSERGRRQGNQVLEPWRRARGLARSARPEPPASRWSDDRVEWLIGTDVGLQLEGTIEGLADILDGDLVSEAFIGADVQLRDVVAHFFQFGAPAAERFAFVGVAMDEHDRA